MATLTMKFFIHSFGLLFVYDGYMLKLATRQPCHSTPSSLLVNSSFPHTLRSFSQSHASFPRVYPHRILPL